MISAEIINIGDELLIGQVINTNASWLSQQLNVLGIDTVRATVVADTYASIIDCLKESASRSSLVIITGGLGPTKDDVTKHALCEFFNASLVENSDVITDVTNFFLQRGISLSYLNRTQAFVPDNCQVLRNPCGTAPGMWFEYNQQVIISLPGVPYEMKEIFQKSIVARLQEKWHLPALLHKTILTTGIGESFLSDKIEQWELQLPKTIRLAYLPATGIVKLRLSTTTEFADVLSIEQAKLETLISDYIFGYDDETLESVIGKLLRSKNNTVATAESCTGGLIAHLITSISGSSAYFKGSVVAYSNDVKLHTLKVNNETITKYGVVSEEVVTQMAIGVKQLLKTDYAIAVSGIAGPDGGTDLKPVGTVCIAIATPKHTISQTFKFGENRERNIYRSAIVALNMLRKQLI